MEDEIVFALFPIGAEGAEVGSAVDEFVFEGIVPGVLRNRAEELLPASRFGVGGDGDQGGQALFCGRVISAEDTVGLKGSADFCEGSFGGILKDVGGDLGGEFLEVEDPALLVETDGHRLGIEEEDSGGFASFERDLFGTGDVFGEELPGCLGTGEALGRFDVLVGEEEAGRFFVLCFDGLDEVAGGEDGGVFFSREGQGEKESEEGEEDGGFHGGIVAWGSRDRRGEIALLGGNCASEGSEVLFYRALRGKLTDPSCGDVPPLENLLRNEL